MPGRSANDLRRSDLNDEPLGSGAVHAFDDLLIHAILNRSNNPCFEPTPPRSRDARRATSFVGVIHLLSRGSATNGGPGAEESIDEGLFASR